MTTVATSPSAAAQSAAGAPSAIPAGVASSLVGGGLGYVPLATPCKAVDTRGTSYVLGAMSPDDLRAFQVAGTGNLSGQGGEPLGCGVPDGVAAVEVTITAIGPIRAGFLRAFAKVDPPVVPNATLVNYTNGRGISNTATVPLRVDSGIQDLYVKNFGGTTHVRIDVLGYFTGTGGTEYTPLKPPCRVADTRAVPGGRLAADAFREFRIAGPNLSGQGGPNFGCIPDGVDAAEVSITVVGASATGFLQVAPNAGIPSFSTFVNFTAGVNITNTGTVTLATATANDLIVRASGADVDVLIDVQGYFDDALPGARYQPLTPCRVMDTRSVGGPVGVGSPFGPNTTRFLQVGGEFVGFPAQGATSAIGCAVPQGAVAVEAAVTATAPVGSGFTRPYPVGSSASTTFLNYSPAGGITNAGALTLGGAGLQDLAITNFGGTAQYLVDVLGYFGNQVTDFRVEQSVAGGLHSCALVTPTGQVECWGANGSGQRGDAIGVTSPADTSVRFIPFLDEVVQVSSSGSGVIDTHTCVVLGVGFANVKCFGSNSEGQIGDGTTTLRSSPTVVPGLGFVVQVSAGSRFTCAVVVDGTVRCWGRNNEGQLGDGTTVDRLSPTAVPGLTDVVQVSAGEFHACALRRDGTVRCWGSNADGRLGDNTTTNRTSPVAVVSTTGSGALGGVVQVAAGGSHTCAVLADSTVRCWGPASRNGNGGINKIGRPMVVTSAGTTPLTGVGQISAGSTHTCAVRADSTAWCWGFGNDGRLGNGSIADQVRPVAVSTATGFDSVAQVSGGNAHTCGVTADGNAFCWGSDSGRQLGGPAGNRTTPQQVSLLTP
jgi:alpha-tubulin suppressor-like RCC1 family protein